MTTQAAHTNHLVHETSLYLKQHAHNPVDWYPWGEEAFSLARTFGRPIFLSIGYSACHWCHVMEHESFEDPKIARILNDYFVSIKVDREERPDLDQIYMTAVQLLTGQGGWPMSMFLTPDLRPFYGGTYFPPDDKFGRPSFKRLLLGIKEAWQNRRDEILQSAGQITEHVNRLTQLEPSEENLAPGLIKNAVSTLGRNFDSTFGGFGTAPKFPHGIELRLLLRAWKRFGDDNALNITRVTLDHMAMGGIYDHLGGGFHRYSTDQRWLVPHFEKMLYDNALLCSAYLDAYQATTEPRYREVVDETLGYVLREMTSPEGAFYSTQDADSEGVEGKFYVWSTTEVRAILGQELADCFEDIYGLSDDGNWEGHNILNRTKTYEQQARLRGLPESELRGMLGQAKNKLFAVREKRVKPNRDEKVLVAWNGLMIAAFAQGASVLQNGEYSKAAARAADFILGRMRGSDGSLYRTYNAGSEPKLNGYLEDYSLFIDALVSLYEATSDSRWIEAAIDLSDIMIGNFWDHQNGGFYFTGQNHETLIARTKDAQDSSIPSGNSMAVTALLRLAKLTARTDYWEKSENVLRLFVELMGKHSMAAGQMLNALDFYIGPVLEIAVVGDPAGADTRQVLHLLNGMFRPNKVIAQKSTLENASRAEELIPFLSGKTSLESVTTYLCENFTCHEPLIGVAALETVLAGQN